MMRVLHLTFLVAIAMVAPLRATADMSDLYERPLRAALARAYAGVESWEIQSLGRQSATIMSATPMRIEVLRVGPRAAIALIERDAGGREQRRVQWYSVRGLQSVWVANESFAARAPLGANHARRETIDVLARRCTPIATPAALDGMRLRRPQAAGAAWCTEDLEPIPSVARGAPLSVSARRGAVALETEVVALADARVGDRVRVRRAPNGEVFTVCVVGPRQGELCE
jgi:flagella basal body P-ring formation protein FlgA